MKNKNILYLITILITLFSFNLNVNAAQELTCVYEMPQTADHDNSFYKIAMIQYRSGNRNIYINRSNETIEGENWQKLSDSLIDINLEEITESKKDQNGDLTVCPEYSNLNLNTEDKYVIFSEVYEGGLSWDGPWGYEKLADGGNYTSIIEPKTVVTPIEQENKEWLSTIDGTKYTGSCKYERTIEKVGTHTIVINFGEKDISFVEYDPQKGIYSSMINFFYIEDKNYSYKFNINDNFTLSNFLNEYGGNCADYIKVDRKYSESKGIFGIKGDKFITSTVGKNDGDLYVIKDVRGYNPLTEELLTINLEKNPQFIKTKIEDCKDLLGEDLVNYFDFIWKIIKIVVPILLVGLGTLDFAQAVFAGKEDDMKKAQGKFIKRIIIAAVIFLIPTILSLLLNLANNVWGNIGKDICGILF